MPDDRDVCRLNRNLEIGKENTWQRPLEANHEAGKIAHRALRQVTMDLLSIVSIENIHEACDLHLVVDLFFWRREDANIRHALRIDETAGIVLESRTDEIAACRASSSHRRSAVAA